MQLCAAILLANLLVMTWPSFGIHTCMTSTCGGVQAHRAGRKHRRRVEAAAGRSTVKSSAHYCPLCEISTTSSAHLALHLVGRAHRRRQKALEEGDSLHPVSLLQPTAAVFASDSLGTPLFPSPAHPFIWLQEADCSVQASSHLTGASTHCILAQVGKDLL